MKPIRGHQLSLFGSSIEIGTSRAARLLNTSQDTIIRLIEEGKLKGYRIHGDTGWWRISYDSLVAYRNYLREKFGLLPQDAEKGADADEPAFIR